MRSAVMLVVCSALVVVLAAQEPPPDARAGQETPAQLVAAKKPSPEEDAEARTVTERFCGTACHGLPTVIKSGRTRAGWRYVVEEMNARGATAHDDAADVIVDYLSRHYPLRVNVNTASARQIADALEVRVAQGVAIVAYRDEHGPFSSWKDVARVPGIDAANVESKKERLLF